MILTSLLLINSMSYDQPLCLQAYHLCLVLKIQY